MIHSTSRLKLKEKSNLLLWLSPNAISIFNTPTQNEQTFFRSYA